MNSGKQVRCKPGSELLHLSLSIRELNENDEEAFLNGLRDWSIEDRSWMTFEWVPGMSHVDHLNILYNYKNGIGVPSHFVASTMLYGFLGDQVVGRVHPGYNYLSNELKVEKVLITCDQINTGSIRIIEALGGKLENIVPDKYDIPTCRYWV